MSDACVAVFAPCRFGLAGGGTDLPAYAERYGGAVLSATVNLGAAVTAKPLGGGRVTLELVDFGWRAEYEGVAALRRDAPPQAALAAAALTAARPAGGVAITVRTGLPPGSGLGTSGAVGVALTYALHYLVEKDPRRRR